MNCNQYLHHLTNLLGGRLDPDWRQEFEEHERGCERCARTASAAHHAITALRSTPRIGASPQFKDRVMEQIRTMEDETRPARGRTWRMAGIAAAACLLLAMAGLINLAGDSPGLTAFGTLARAAEVMSGVNSVRITARMSTRPYENFEWIGAHCEPIPLEIWTEPGAQPRWRIEKEGRIVVMDGEQIIGWIKPPSNLAYRAQPEAGVVSWLRPLLDPGQLLQAELERARQDGSTLLLERLSDPVGRPLLAVSVVANAKGDYSQSDYARNSSIIESDHSRLYIFDAASGRLEQMRVMIETAAGPVTVFEISAIEYNQPFEDNIFALELPADVNWALAPEALPADPILAARTPEQVARDFFEACNKEDWDRVSILFSETSISQPIRQHLGELEIISLGKPFKSGLYPGWFVPYEIRFRGGETKKWNLAVRNDNPAGRWIVDGGI